MARPRLPLTWSVVFLAGCVPEPTQIRVAPAVVTWLEWPTAVTTDQPGALRVSGSTQCGFRLVFGVTVSDREIRVSAEGIGGDEAYACPGWHDADAAGAAQVEVVALAGPDTLLPLPPLERPHGEIITYALKAPMSSPWWGASPQTVGWIESRTSVDTTTRFAGHAFLYADSASCWWLRPPSSLWPAPRWALKGPVPLLPRSSWYSASVVGLFVEVTPPICGEAVAARAFRLEADVTPWGTVARAQSGP